MPTEDEINTKDKLLETVATLRRRAEEQDGKIGQLSQAVDGLSTVYRDVRRAADSAYEVRPSGTEGDAYDRYCVQAADVKDRIATRGGLQYGTETRPIGREYGASRDSATAVRLVSEQDEIGDVRYGYLDDPEPVTSHQIELQTLVSRRNMARMLLAKPGSRGTIELGATPKLDRAIARCVQSGPAWIKQVFADNAGEGGEFIPDVVMPELGRVVELPRNVAALFADMPIPVGGTTTNPFLTAGCQPFLVGTPAAGDLDPADIQRSVPTTTSISTAPKTLGVSLPASLDATEDSIVEWGAFGMLMLAEALRDGKEDVWINGDLNGQDTGLASWNIRSRWPTLGSTLDHRKTAIGLRAHAYDSSADHAIGTESAAGLQTELAYMSSPQFMGDVVHITSPEWVLLKLITDSNLMTVDKYGQNATVITGEIGQIFGRRVVVSEFVDRQYNASGIYDNATKTKTGVLSVNVSRWRNGVRRGPRVAVEVIARQHLSVMTVTERWLPRHMGRATEKSVVWSYNATAS